MARTRFQSRKVPRTSTYGPWKLPTYEGRPTAELRIELAQKGYHFRINSRRRRLLHLLKRADRGLVSYDYVYGGVEGLKKFCKDRGIVVKAKRRTEMALIRALEDADETRTLTKFKQLPSELRNMVYQQHTDWLRQMPTSTRYSVLAAPPLAATALGKEFAPLFHNETRPKMLICVPGGDAFGWGAHWDNSSGKLFHSSNSHQLKYIRRLRIDIYIMQGQIGSFGLDEALQVDVDFGFKNDGQGGTQRYAEISYSHNAVATFKEGWAEKIGILKKHIGKKIDEMAEAEGDVLYEEDPEEMMEIVRGVAERKVLRD